MLYKVGLIIGRFQPFHKGHLYLIKKALKQSEKIIIGIGSANVKDEKNPFSFNERKKQILTALRKNKLLNKVKKIVPLDDYPDDNDYWLKQLKKKTGFFEVVFSNNDYVNGILQSRGVKVVSFPFYKRNIYEGTKIREKMKNT
jgi:nicotinamide-nucleotide adenylyltransferase